ncbi:phosphatidate cytidylyltransferase [Azospirillum melinis]|uniref:Phosphatidate cytidylyltransferase n=1 Tax=Azospirillum melinis TaxID=328839 RepID=A0ABX2K4D4_9PROT|nr:phosphatidate cytidylyltransferase [Azospirillum melinis]MBP2304045.1 phosphatidate cytidylyltransferase [Azospirillum melinis]NUA98411.1 phosphatidate cytidylyltransferase [Azospirillum melinis]
MKSSTDGNAASAPPPPGPADSAAPAAVPAKPSKTGDLKVRVLSALVMAPVVLGAVWAGGWVFHALIAFGSVIAVSEWTSIVPSARRLPARLMATIGILVALMVQIVAGPAAGLGAAAAFAVLTAIVGGGSDRGLLGFGVLYVAVGMAGLMWLRDLPDSGLSLFLFVLFAIWATDIGAYAAGRSIGGPKLAPRISPKKTWAGLIGGMAASALFGWLVALAFGAARPDIALAVGAATAVVGQAGDLFESAVKRRYNVKDSGQLIPGHGGILDRIDGLLAAAPVLALFHAAVGSVLSWW